MPGAAEPRTVRGRAKRDQIRAGARRRFLSQGFTAASTDAIAAEAGVSKQTLYAYYRSKEDLLVDVLRSVVGEPATRSTDAPGVAIETIDDLRTALNTLAYEVIDRLMRPDYLGLMRVIFAEIPRLPQLGELWTDTVAVQVLDRLMPLLEHARARDLAEFPDLDLAARAFMGPLMTYVVLDGLLVGGDPHPPAAGPVEQLVELYLRGITPRPTP